jgi:hypothetical protein
MTRPSRRSSVPPRPPLGASVALDLYRIARVITQDHAIAPLRDVLRRR